MKIATLQRRPQARPHLQRLQSGCTNGLGTDDGQGGIRFRGAAISTIPPATSAQIFATSLATASSTAAQPSTRGKHTPSSPRNLPAEPRFANVTTTLAQGAAAIQRYRADGLRSDLDSAVHIYWNLHLILMPHHPDYFPCRYQLCILLSERFDLWGTESDVDKAVELGEELSLATTGVALKDRVDYLRACARAYALRFDGTTQASDASRAVDLVEEAESLPVDGSAVNRDLLIWHGRALFYLYEAKGDFRRLQESIRFLTCTLSELDDDSESRSLCLLFLSEAHRSRQDKLNERTEVAKILSYAETAVNLATPHNPRRPRYLNALAIALQRHSLTHHLQEPTSLHRAIAVAQEAVQCVREGDRRYTALLTTTSNGLRYRYHLGGDYNDINDCVQIQEKSLRLRSEHQKGYNAAVYGLCLSLIYRFRSNGSLNDIDRSIAILQERCAALAANMPMHAQFLNVLSQGFMERWYYFNTISDLQKALDLCKEVVTTISGGGYLANVGVCYYELYLHNSNAEDLENAIDWMTKADGRRESIYDLPEHLLAYGKAYVARAKLLKQAMDWNEGVKFLRSALDHSPPGHKRRAQTLMALGNALLARYRAVQDRTCLEESRQLLTDCLENVASGLEKTKCRLLLADTVAEHGPAFGALTYPLDLLALLESAASDSEALSADRFTAALKWASLAQENQHLEEAYRAFAAAVSLLPHVAWLGYGRDVRLQELRARAGTLAVDAAAAAIAVGRYDRALELLESGRGIFWRQLLQLRTEVDELQDVSPKVAEELQDVGRALEADVPTSGALENEHLMQRHRRLAERWEQLVTAVRKLEGFEDFLQATKFSQLSEAAKEGPVVIINGSTTRVDALILTPDHRNYHCALPGMQARLAIQLAEFLRHALSVPKDQRGLAFMEYAVRSVLDRLWHTVVSPIRAALNSIYTDGLPHRIWLLPTGPFCLLPIHAAGFCSVPSSGIGQDMVCSYTATLGALIRARKIPRGEHGGPRLLAISQSSTPGQEPLVCSNEEMQIVKNIAPHDTVTCIYGEEATVTKICDELLQAEWVHLSCHGNSNPENPLLSCFRFFDGPLSLSDISKLRLPHADFAFLSACHTARPAGELPDESLHLAAALQLAGFKSILATQWGIADKDAPVVTRDVYQYMFTSGHGNFRSSAEALHHAVAHLKRRGLPAIRWVPFVHLGI
ncbi:hypothetical protein CALVIDRAFT_494510 [Calocera viscosa TUFC12733]|uniref:CHAT domain-containing protein n=1 Tax=Calocera viscosa (strain TUFC12733) TaxID=1330018 RepID=A0A167QDL0_CALVF|nr:hypothetical protein CALVIDRAFT_494510 [Calocera viscosa TUFC12733]